MSALVVQSAQWNSLPHFSEVAPFGDADAECLNEVRLVLQKFGNLRRFGVALLHNHFKVEADEIMMETTDLERREHYVRPMKVAEIEAAGIVPSTTIVSFDEKGYNLRCGCDPRSTGHHHK